MKLRNLKTMSWLFVLMGLSLSSCQKKAQKKQTPPKANKLTPSQVRKPEQAKPIKQAKKAKKAPTKPSNVISLLNADGKRLTLGAPWSPATVLVFFRGDW